MKKKCFLLLGFVLSFVASINAQTETFEGAGVVKTTYASGTVTGAAYQWNFTSALIGSSASDRFNGTKSARIQSTGTITMLQDKANGLGTVTIYHALYGTDASTTWRMDVSNDGGATWIAYSSSTITTTSTTLTLQTFTVNIAGSNIRIRIVKLSGGTNSRLNIDDITLGDYTATQTITTGTVSGSPYCITPTTGAVVSVPYTVGGSGTFNSDNIFTAQLSDANGSFSTPTDIGNIAATTSGTISATIPANTANGTGYKIQVVASDPSITSQTTSSALTVQLSTPDASGFNTSSVTTNSVTLGWTNPSLCFDQVIVIASTSNVTTVPSGSGAAYTPASAAYGSPGYNFTGNEYLVYSGSPAASSNSSLTVTSLTVNTTYFFKLYVRKGTFWSSGIILNATPTTDQVGDYRTDGVSGHACTWSSTTNWQTFNGASWVTATIKPDSYTGSVAPNVTIQNGNVVTLTASLGNSHPINKLTINTGGQLATFVTAASTSNRYISVYGDIICNGSIGNGAGVYDVICFNMDGVNQTISGTGSFNASRIRKNNTTLNATTNLVIAMNVNLMFAATASFSGTEIYNDGNNGASTGSSNFNVTVNQNSILNLQLAPASTGSTATSGNLSVDGVAGEGLSEWGGTFTINGTLNVPGTIYAYTDNTTNAVKYIIGNSGVVNCVNVATANTSSATTLVQTGSAAAGCTIQILNGGKLNLNGGTGTTYTTYYTALTSSNADYNESFCVATGSATFAPGLATNSNFHYDFQPGSTVEYSSGSGSMVIQPNLIYSNLLISGAGTKTFSSTVTANNNVTITSPAILSGGANTINVGGDWNDYGTAGLTEGTGTVVFNGATTQNIYCPGGENFYKATFTSAGTKTLHDPINTASDLTINSGSGALISNGNNIFVAGNWVNNQGTSGFTEGTDIVTMNGSSAQTITTTGGEDFYNLTVNNTATYPTGVTLGSDVHISNTASGGTLFFNAGSLNASTFTLDGPGNLSMNANTNLTLAKNNVVLPELTGTYSLNGGAVIFNGTGAQTVRAVNYFDLTSLSASGGTRILPTTGTVGIADALTPGTNLYTITSSTVNFNGSGDQNIPGLPTASASPYTNEFNILQTSGSGIKTTTTDFTILNNIAPGDGTTLNLNSTVTIKSDAGNTARVAAVGTAVLTYGTGKFNIERYLPMLTPYTSRRWRLLTAPLSSTNAPTINAAWQEGATNSNKNSVNNPNPGYGTDITFSTTSANGYDQGSTNNPSIYTMPYASNLWTTLTATNTGKITDNPGYMLFVRGDRSIVVSTQYINTTAGTILRAAGQINTGNVTTSIISGNQVIANPYASAISFNGVNYNGVTPGTTVGSTYYLWDPKLLGYNSVGKWATFSSNGNNTYTIVPNAIDSTYMSNYGNTGNIESGSAFMIKPVASGSFIIHESDKVTTSSTIGLASRPEGLINIDGRLFTNLAYVNDTGSAILSDGVATLFSSSYNNEVDQQDAVKLQSFAGNERIGLLRSGNLLSIERRKSIAVTDTIFFNTNVAANTNYQLQFIGSDFDPSLQALLEDKFTHAATEINTSGVALYNFITTSDTLSTATDRFYLIFSRPASASPVPVTFISVKASQQNNDIAVQWNVANEININEYKVEKSTDGIHFTVMATVKAGNNPLSAQYNSIDDNVVDGYNYYRIESIGVNGSTAFSQIVKVKTGDAVPSISIYPNPVTDGVVELQLNNMPKGLYNIRLLNAAGQLMMDKALTHAGGNASETLQLNAGMAKGIYQLEIVKPDNSNTTIKMVYQ